MIRLGDSLEKVGGLKKADPSKVKINGSSAPDFSKPPTDTYKTISPTAGEVDVEIFKSLDGKITYSIMKDKEGKIWIGNATKVDSKLTSFGVASESVDLGAASMPRWEYWDQTPYQYRSSGSSHPIKKDYVDSWHFLKETPVIKGYYQAKGIPLP